MADAWVAIRDAAAASFGIKTKDLRDDALEMARRVDATNSGNSFQRFVFDGSSIANDRQYWIPVLDDINPADVVEAPLYPVDVRSIEQNIDECARLIDAADRLRDKYTDLAAHYLDARLRIEEFLRNDEVHKLEVAAGIYELPWQEAETEYGALQVRVRHLELARNYAQQALDTGELGGVEVERQVTMLKQQTANTKNTYDNADIAAFDTENLARQRMGLEVRSWTVNLRMLEAQHEEAKSRVDGAGKRASYLRNDIAFRQSRTLIARDLTYQRLYEHCQKNGEVSYPQRLAEIKSVFDTYAQQIILRVRAIYVGASSLYRLNVTHPELTKGQIFEAARRWLSETRDLVLRYKHFELTRVFSFSVALQSHKHDVLKAITDGVSFDIARRDTAGADGLLRGIALEYVGEPNLPISVSAIVPSGVPVRPEMNEFLFGRVLQPQTSDLQPQYLQQSWNGSPYGTWRLQLSPNSPPLTKLTDVFVHLWIAHRA